MINYIDVNPHASQTLVFIHGNSHSLKTFKGQIISSLFKDYRMLFIDLPGHGDSERLPKYSLTIIADILVSFLKKLELQNIILIGHSLGGHVAINMLESLTPKAIFLYGTPPLNNPFVSESFLANANAVALHKNIPDDEEIYTLMTEMKYDDFSMLDHFNDFRKTDTKFRTEILEDVINSQHLNEIKIIDTFVGQVSILLARQDSLINNSYIENLLSFKKIDTVVIEAGHSPHVEAPLEFNTILLKFIQKVF